MLCANDEAKQECQLLQCHITGVCTPELQSCTQWAAAEANTLIVHGACRARLRSFLRDTPEMTFEPWRNATVLGKTGRSHACEGGRGQVNSFFKPSGSAEGGALSSQNHWRVLRDMSWSRSVRIGSNRPVRKHKKLSGFLSG